MSLLPRRGPGRPRKVPAVQQRAQVLRAAREVFAKAGLRAATIEEVANRAGVTRHAVYEQFGDKCTLFNAVIVALMDELDAALGPPGGEAADELDDEAWVRACFGQALHYLSGHPEIELLVREAMRSDDPLLGQVRPRLTKRYADELRRRWDRRGVQLGGSAELAVVMAMGMTEAVAALPWGERSPDVPALVEVLSVFTVGGMTAVMKDAPEHLRRLA